MKGYWHALALFLSAASVSACSAVEEESLSAQAEAHHRPTFVSLNPCLDEILVELLEPITDDDQILAISHYSHDETSSSMPLRDSKWFASTGGTAEEVIALAPDIVLASTFIAPPTKRALQRAGIRVETFSSPASVEESAQQVERIGSLAGKADRAAFEARHMRNPIPSLIHAWDPGPDPSVLLWQSGQIVAGEGSLIAQLIREAGFTNHATELGYGQADYVSLEDVLINPPDLLLIAGESAGQEHPVLSQLTQTRIHRFDPNLFYCGGPSIWEARVVLGDLRYSFGKPDGQAP